ncbi:hypothetical protein ACOKM3_38560 [Streptomyces sp. BH106]|uniref:hypothetical protein n=1 Tax=Streptomyces sp. BH106 TaxID=3410409 RepID=UPI003CF775B4
MTPPAELESLLDGLGDELAAWRRLAVDEKATLSRAPLEKHRSQLRSVEVMLNEGIAAARAELATGSDAAGLPVLVLDLHHVWDYFRSKFALRRLDEYRGYLDAADELAWACYEGPLNAALATGDARPKEPPLVSFSRDPAPRAHRRGGQYRDLLPRGGMHTRAGVELVRSLPFPVIDVPWYYGSHVPAVLTVAHEVGHHIEDDFGLTETLAVRLAGTSLPEAWIGEVFADVCASLACGVAYPAVLADVVGTLVEPEPAGDTQELSPHPPLGTRLRICRAALDLAGHERPKTWPAPIAEVLADGHDPSSTEVVAAFLGDGYPQFACRRLPDLLPSAPVTQMHADRLLAGIPSGLSHVPGVFAAAALAFLTCPGEYRARRVGTRAVSEALALRPKGPRAEERTAAAASGGRLLRALRAADTEQSAGADQWARTELKPPPPRADP